MQSVTTLSTNFQDFSLIWSRVWTAVTLTNTDNNISCIDTSYLKLFALWEIHVNNTNIIRRKVINSLCWPQLTFTEILITHEILTDISEIDCLWSISPTKHSWLRVHPKCKQRVSIIAWNHWSLHVLFIYMYICYISLLPI